MASNTGNGTGTFLPDFDEPSSILGSERKQTQHYSWIDSRILFSIYSKQPILSNTNPDTALNLHPSV